MKERENRMLTSKGRGKKGTERENETMEMTEGRGEEGRREGEACRTN